jgi:hypothetical protein
VSITDFLLARIAEDEAEAQSATMGPWLRGKFVDKKRYDRMGPEWKADRAAEESTFVRAGGVEGDHVAIVRNPADVQFIARWDPARVLAECAAKRAIVDLYERHRDNRDARRSPRARAAEDEKAAQDRRTQEARTRVADDAMRALAAVYADHPDYQPEWAL